MRSKRPGAYTVFPMDAPYPIEVVSSANNDVTFYEAHIGPTYECGECGERNEFYQNDYICKKCRDLLH